MLVKIYSSMHYSAVHESIRYIYIYFYMQLNNALKNTSEPTVSLVNLGCNKQNWSHAKGHCFAWPNWVPMLFLSLLGSAQYSMWIKLSVKQPRNKTWAKWNTDTARATNIHIHKVDNIKDATKRQDNYFLQKNTQVKENHAYSGLEAFSACLLSKNSALCLSTYSL